MSPSTPARPNPNHVNVSRDDAKNSMASCWLMKSTLQLVPLRYGLVDGAALDPSSEIPVPYTLGTRPLGLRLLRDGWLYVIDSQTGALSEYRLIDGLVSAMHWQGTEVTSDARGYPIKKPVLIYSKRSTLHVSYSEIQWTAKKCHQVLKSRSERTRFMQAVDLTQANCETGGPGLLMPERAERWVAEVATARVLREQIDQDEAAATAREEAENVERRKRGQPDVKTTFIPTVNVYSYPEHERVPYVWEKPERFRESSMTPLSSCIEAEYRHDVLYLVVEDDIGVMRDLANYQDQVVEWIDTWAKGDSQDGANERDYLLACYIESLTLLTGESVGGLAEASDDPAIKRMLGDLESLQEPEKSATRQTLVDYLNKGGLPTPPQGTPVPPALNKLRQEALDDARYMIHHKQMSQGIDETDRRYYTGEHFKTSPQDFVKKHFEALIKLGKEQDRRIKETLEGAKFGQRGINELIDRDAMDSALFEHRHGLKRWNTLLDHITADRVALLCAGRFHRSAWYYDPENDKQIGQAFATEYACLRDICRSDKACELILEYLEKQPQLSRPLFYTLSDSDQRDLWVKYAFVQAAGMTLFNDVNAYLKKLREIEQNRLPALDQLSEDLRAVADAAQQTMSPALNRGIENVLADFDQVLKGQPMPDLDQLFRRLPKMLSTRILDAAKREGVTFTVSSEAEKTALKNTLKDLFEERKYLQKLTHERNRVKRTAGHQSPKARQLQVDIAYARQQLAGTEARLAGALSPIGGLPDTSVRLFGATPVRAGLTVVFPPASQQAISGLMKNFRDGVKTAPKLHQMGDGAALLLFVVQAINLREVLVEAAAQTGNKRSLGPVINAAVATGAAGFAAAQGVFDTALTARSSALARGLQNHAVAHVQVQMGKLHIGLGVATYAFGVAAAAASLKGYQSSWEQAVRSGNEGAQAGAILSMAGAGGLLASNLYGLGSTFEAGYAVLMAEKGARATVWAVSGVRLSSVFFRANLAGALFTVLELGGNYMYNYYNTSAHDQWLQSTPWGKDADKRQSLSLTQFQNALLAIVQVPSVTVGPVEYDGWWKNLLLRAKVGDIHVLFPGLDTAAFQAPLGDRPSHQLKIAAYRINTIRLDRGVNTERWEELSEPVEARLRRVEGNQIILCVGYPETYERVVGKVREELMLVVVIQNIRSAGLPQQTTHYFRLDPRGSGTFPALDQAPYLPQAPLLYVETLMLELVSHD